jgi:hypothetical protein
LKNELIITDKVDQDELMNVVMLAKDFFLTKLGIENEKSMKILVNEEGGYDIEYKGIELGSYGIRECPFLAWIYATGCAEPRLSTCQNLRTWKKQDTDTI